VAIVWHEILGFPQIAARVVERRRWPGVLPPMKVTTVTAAKPQASRRKSVELIIANC